MQTRRKPWSLPAPPLTGKTDWAALLTLHLPKDGTEISFPKKARTIPATHCLGCSAISSLCPSNISNDQIICNMLSYPTPTRAVSQVAGILYNPPKDQEMIFHSFLSIREKKRDLGSIVIRVNCSF